MKRFFKEYGLYTLAIFLIYGWVEYYTILRNNSNYEEFLIISVFMIVFWTNLTVILPYYLLYSSQFKSFIDKIIKSDKAKKITYYIISIATNYYVISTIIEIKNKYN